MEDCKGLALMTLGKIEQMTKLVKRSQRGSRQSHMQLQQGWSTTYVLGNTRYWELIMGCRAPFHEECLKHHGHKGDPAVIVEICSAINEKAQMIQVWVKAPGVGNASHPQRLGVTMGKAMSYVQLMACRFQNAQVYLNQRSALGDMTFSVGCCLGTTPCTGCDQGVAPQISQL